MKSHFLSNYASFKDTWYLCHQSHIELTSETSFSRDSAILHRTEIKKTIKTFPNRHGPDLHLPQSQTIGRLTWLDRKSGLSPMTVPEMSHGYIIQSILGSIMITWVISIFLQKCYISGQGGITAGVMVHTMLTHLVQTLSKGPQMDLMGTTGLGAIPSWPHFADILGRGLLRV